MDAAVTFRVRSRARFRFGNDAGSPCFQRIDAAIFLAIRAANVLKKLRLVQSHPFRQYAKKSNRVLAGHPRSSHGRAASANPAEVAAISASLPPLLWRRLGLLPEPHARIDVTRRVPPAVCRSHTLLPGRIHALAGPAEIVANDTPGIIAFCVRSRKRSHKDQQGHDCGSHLDSPGDDALKESFKGPKLMAGLGLGSCG